MNKLFTNPQYDCRAGALCRRVQPQRLRPRRPLRQRHRQLVIRQCLANPSATIVLQISSPATNAPAPANSSCAEQAGMALWIDPAQKINTVYLYAESENGFAPIEGEMPFGLTFKDSMADVEQKFGQPKVPQAPQAGWEPGLPDAGSSPDHIHYWAVYERFGVTIVYNTPFANDKNASIHSILVTK